MDQLEIKIEGLEKKIDLLQRSLDKLRRIFFLTLMITLALFFLPLVGLVFVIPQFLSVYSRVLQ